MNYQEALDELECYSIQWAVNYMDIETSVRMLNHSKLLQQLIDERIEEESKTMFGYPIKHLVLIANWVRKNDITPEVLKSSIESMKYGYDKAYQEIEESFKRTFKTMNGGDKDEL